ncbi:hypothetical protein [Flavobacterium sp.]|uniref:hypothetical protein n=1 Tax=Flavobacterium sp. TaxID=239 RepID=UPI0025E945EE|nr:hypothetical protein [Flavobacterium sp.]
MKDKKKTRINVSINIVEYVERSNREYERRRTIIDEALYSIVKEENVRYKEAKRILSGRLKFDVMCRLMADVK